jgi:hypothetical protein
VGVVVVGVVVVIGGGVVVVTDGEVVLAGGVVVDVGGTVAVVGSDCCAPDAADTRPGAKGRTAAATTATSAILLRWWMAGSPTLARAGTAGAYAGARILRPSPVPSGSVR